ncbi:hypothetical protein [Ochrobactrum sp. A-1]|uniref:hypothetical protein n=1 Tax=Ochrobactrum sp. A-1 TaxID=2920940 RepID=UPI001F0A620E|nr:hypothetical protein [Ochrobactrum sp. A-1]
MARITANALRDRVSLEKREEVDDGYGNTYGRGSHSSSAMPASFHRKAARPSSPRACKASSQP